MMTAMIDGHPVRNAVTMNMGPSTPMTALNACMPYMTCVSFTMPSEGIISGVTSVDAISFRLYAVLLDHLAPPGDFPKQELLQLGRSADNEIHAQILGQLLAQIRLVERFDQLRVELVEHRPGRSR